MCEPPTFHFGALAMADRESYRSPLNSTPVESTVTRSVSPLYRRTIAWPGRGSRSSRVSSALGATTPSTRARGGVARTAAPSGLPLASSAARASASWLSPP
jgi:hypothetical protein